MQRPTVRTLIPFAALAALAGAGPATAQTRGCAVTPYTDPPREVLSCRGGLTIAAPRGTVYQLLDRNRDGVPDAASLTGGGLLIDLAPGRRGSFQILTPHAIASVRGTVWATDVSPAATAVFVQEGRVGVQRRSGGAGVVLKAGDGVDVDAGAGPLAVKRWSALRAASLLARFGR